MKFKRADFFSIPNILTYLRILLVPVFCVVYANAQSWTDHIWALAVVLIAAFTDVVDGLIARKWNMITDWGKIVDPIADKAMQGAMMFCVIIKYPLVIILIVLYAIKEFSSLALTSYLFKKGKTIDGARWYGKACTVVLYIAMIVFIVFPTVPSTVIGMLVGISATFMVLAFILYMNDYLTLYKELQQEIKDGTYKEPGQMFFIRKDQSKSRYKKKHPDENVDNAPLDEDNEDANLNSENVEA